jgi:hypothetical protein
MVCGVDLVALLPVARLGASLDDAGLLKEASSIRNGQLFVQNSGKDAKQRSRETGQYL